MSIVDSNIILTTDKSHILDRSWEYIKSYLNNSHIIHLIAKLRDKIDENKYNKSNYTLNNIIIEIINNIIALLKFNYKVLNVHGEVLF
jgi:hypothetical protein